MPKYKKKLTVPFFLIVIKKKLNLGLQRTDGVYGAFTVFDKQTTQRLKIKVPNKKTQYKIAHKIYDKEFYLIVQDWNHRLAEEMFKYPLWKNFKYTQGYTNKMCTLRMRVDDGSSLPWYF